MLKRFKTQISSIAEDVSSTLFTVPVDSSTNDLNPHDNHKPATTIHDLTLDSPEPEPSSRTISARKPFTKIVDVLLSEEDEIDSAPHNAEGPNKRLKFLDGSSRRPVVLASSEPLLKRHEQTPTHDQRSSPEERRALGLIERPPRDAVKVILPQSRLKSSESMPSQKQFPFSGGLRPVDTINDSRQGSRPSRRQLVLTKSGRNFESLAQREPPSITDLDQDLRANDHQQPNKRQRTEDPSILPPRPDRYTTNAQSILQPAARKLKHGPHSPSRIGPGGGDNLRRQSPQQSPMLGNTHKPDTIFSQQSVQRHAPPDNVGTQRKQKRVHSSRVSPRIEPVEHPVVRGTHAKRTHHGSTISNSSSPPAYQPDAKLFFTPRTAVRATPVRLPDESPDELQQGLTVASLLDDQKDPPSVLSSASAKRGHPQKQIANHSHRNAIRPNVHEFELESAYFADSTSANNYMIRLHTSKPRKFILRVKSPALGEDPVLTVDWGKVLKLKHAPDERKIVMGLSSGVLTGNQLFLEFLTEKSKDDFVCLVRDHDKLIKIQQQDKLSRIFENGKREVAAAEARLDSQSLRHLRTAIDPPQQTPTDEKQVNQKSRPRRLVDNLDSPLSSTGKLLTIITGVERATRSNLADTRLDPEAMPNHRRSLFKPERSQPIGNTSTATHSTRFKARKMSPEKSDKDESRSLRPDVCELIDSWSQKPLVFTGPQKKSETLSWEDVQRLNEDQFLNDNMISFFLLYLQNQIDPGTLKKMHFFNTFFFSALTKDQKGRSSINYNAVKRWTKNVNLFTRDFVIVPVNESYHWFVMIICNLPYLRKVEEDTIDHDDSAPVFQDLTSSCDNTVKAESDMTPEVSTRRSFQDLSIEDEDSALPIDTKLSSSGRRSGKRKSGRTPLKYDVRKPIIITLDSLDHQRSSTATTLKKYIAALAADNEQYGGTFTVDLNDIKGMTAKGIPHQDNFSDCGLYLCMYMEQFMTNPTSFVHNILQREAKQGWPGNITSRNLRERFARLVSELYKKQKDSHYMTDIPSLGSIMTEMRHEVSDNEVQIVNDDSRFTAASGKEHAKTQAELVQSISPFSAPAMPDLLRPPTTRAAATEDLQRLTGAPATIIDLSDEAQSRQAAEGHDKDLAAREVTTSRYFRAGQDVAFKALRADAGKSSTKSSHKSPSGLADQIARERSPAQTTQLGDRQLQGSIDRQRRAPSVSTDFLHGEQSYEGYSDTDKPPSAINSPRVAEIALKSKGKKESQRNTVGKKARSVEAPAESDGGEDSCVDAELDEVERHNGEPGTSPPSDSKMLV